MNKRAALVARVSTANQAEYGYSITTQLTSMRKYATDNNFEVVAEIQDHISGTVEVRERPGGAQLYQMVEKREIDAVVFYTIDRVARDEDVVELSILRRDLRRAGIELHYCDTGKSDDSTIGGIIEYIKASYASEERKKIIERSQRGRHAKAQAGKWVGSSHPPYGYRREGSKGDVRLEIDEYEAAIVRRIFAMYTGAGGVKPEPLYEIARQLTREGIKPPLRGRRRSKTFGWYLESVRRIIERRVYLGEFHYAGYTIYLPDLALVDEATWKTAQAQRERNKAQAKRNRKRNYLLSGHIRCVCGSAMSGYTRTRKNNDYSNYVCCHKFRDRHLNPCREFVPRELADQRVWEWLYNQLSEDHIRHGLKRKREREASELNPKRERLETVGELIDKAERKIKRLASTIADTEDETALDVLKAEVKTTSRQKDALIAERERLQAELNQLELSPEGEEEIVRKAAELRAGMLDADFETKRYFLNRLDVQVQVQKNADGQKILDVTCTILHPNEPASIDLHCR